MDIPDPAGGYAGMSKEAMDQCGRAFQLSKMKIFDQLIVF